MAQRKKRASKSKAATTPRKRASAPAASRRRRSAKRGPARAGWWNAVLWTGRLAVVGFGLLLAFEAWRFPNVSRLADHEPGRTSFMDYREREARRAGSDLKLRQVWMPLGRISPLLRQAVLIAEDDRFYMHDGFDLDEIRDSIEDHLRDGKRLRGASTISQQLAKNLWLNPDRSYYRKLREAVYTWALERRLDKDRILELYLNVAEWGPGVFGAEAAARRYFDVPASGLRAEQAALLAAALPNPLERRPDRPTAAHGRRARRIQARLEQLGLANPKVAPASRTPKRAGTSPTPAKAKPTPGSPVSSPATIPVRPPSRATPRDVLRPGPAATPVVSPSPPRDLLQTDPS